MSVNAISSRIFLPGIDGAAGSDGTNGDAEKDLKGVEYAPAPVDNETTDGISAPDESAKYAGNVAGWSETDAYGNNEYAYQIARNTMAQNSYGTNPFQPNDLNLTIQQQIAKRQGHTVGLNLFGLA